MEVYEEADWPGFVLKNLVWLLSYIIPMIMAATRRSSANTLYTLQRRDGQLRATALSPAARA